MKVLLMPAPPSKIGDIASGVDRYLRVLTSAMQGNVSFTYLDDPFFVRRRLGEYKPIVVKASKRTLSKKIIPYGLRLLFGYMRDTFKLAAVMRPYVKKVDIIHVNRVGCETQTIAARLAGFRRIVATIHNLPGEDGPAGHWARKIIEKISFSCTNIVIAVSNSTFEEWQRRIGLSKNKTAMIYNGLEETNLGEFNRDAYRKDLCGDSDAVIFGIVAQLESRKGVGVAIESFARLSKLINRAYLLIAGVGPEEENLKEQVIKLGITDKVIFLGYRTDIYKIITSLDVNISPSISLETLSYPVVESMFMAVPSIASDVGGAKELIAASGGGRITPKNDVAAIYEAMKFYAVNPSSRVADGIAAKEYARKHLTARRMADETYEVYRSLKR